MNEDNRQHDPIFIDLNGNEELQGIGTDGTRLWGKWDGHY
jgi:hypothetical protein